jgi:MoxR-like ATPase
MTNFINRLNKTLEMLGLILAPVLIKVLGCFYKAAEGSMIPCSLLKGLPGSGKTSTAEAFALTVGAKKYFYQCNPGTGFDQLIGQPNLGAVLRQDAAACVADGVVIQAVRSAMAGEDVVLILDEIDKASPEVDAYLLDFLQSRRIHDSNMEELVVPSDVKFWVFLTSNDERELSDALMRRVRRITVDRPSRSTVASVLGIEENATLLDVWELTEKLAISQLRNYLEDGGDPDELDLDILSQYVEGIPDISTLGQQQANSVPAVVAVSFYDKGTIDLISKLESFKWLPESNDDIRIEIPSLTELIRLMMILPVLQYGRI